MKLSRCEKILALILTLCMLFSAFAVISASAKDTLTIKGNSILGFITSGEAKAVFGIREATTVIDFLENFENSKSITVYKDGVALGEQDHVGTGASVVLGDDVAYVVLNGDTDGSGRIDATDYLQIKKFFLDEYVLEGAFIQAADTDGNGSITSTDYLRIKGYFIGTYSLYPEPEEEESSEYYHPEDSSEDISDDEVIYPRGENVSYNELPKADLDGREIFIIERWIGYGNENIDFTGEVLYMEDESGYLSRANKAKKDVIEQIEHDYNCSITGEIFVDRNNNSVASLRNLIITDVTAGVGRYDFFFETPYYYTSFIADGVLSNVNHIPSINLESSCWNQNAVNDLSVRGLNFFLTGDINTYDDESTIAMLFNKELYESLGYTDDLYSLVKEGKWTFNKLAELSLNFDTIDYNQDGEINEWDRWFMGSETSNLYYHVIAAGESICTKNEKDYPILTMKTEKTISSLTDAVEFYISGKVLVADLDYHREKYLNQYYDMTVGNAFLEGRELFCMAPLTTLPRYRDMVDEIGVLPVPKYTQSQAEYVSPTSIYTTTTLMIPNSFLADDNLGLVIQALAELSEEVLTPVYEENLKLKYFEDPECAEMLDIIFDNRHYDLGVVFGAGWNNADQFYRILDTDIENRFSEKEGLIQVLIENTIEDIDDAFSWTVIN